MEARFRMKTGKLQYDLQLWMSYWEIRRFSFCRGVRSILPVSGHPQGLVRPILTQKPHGFRDDETQVRGPFSAPFLVSRARTPRRLRLRNRLR